MSRDQNSRNLFELT